MSEEEKWEALSGKSLLFDIPAGADLPKADEKPVAE